MKKSFRSVVVLVTIMSMVLLAACSGNGKSSNSVKIGFLIPFTGIATFLGEQMKLGAEIALDEYNKEVDGKKIEVFFEDTTSTPDVAVQKANKLMNEKKVDVLIGTLISSERNAVYDVSTKKKVLLINPTYYEGGLINKYFFSTGGLPNQTIQPLVEYSVKNLGKKFYFVGSDYIWGKESIRQAIEFVKASGGEVVGEDYAPMGTTEFSSIIRKIKDAKPDVLVPFVAGADGITFIKQVNSFGLNKELRIIGNSLDDTVVGAFDEAGRNGILNVDNYFSALDNPNNAGFLEKLKAKDPKAVMTSLGTNMYYNVKMYLESVKQTGGTNTDDIVKALEKMEVDGPQGKVTFNPENHYAIQDIYVAEVQNGSYKIIETHEKIKPVLAK